MKLRPQNGRIRKLLLISLIGGLLSINGIMVYNDYKSEQTMAQQERECAEKHNVFKCVYSGAFMPVESLEVK